MVSDIVISAKGDYSAFQKNVQAYGIAVKVI
jgi:hypothetical protein